MSGARPLPYMAEIAALAALYALAGHAGLLLAIPPGYATAVWPPSGIALAWLLLRGHSRWPGVLLGSVLVNITTSWDGSSTTALLRSLAIAGSIGSGAALQAAAGAWLVGRVELRRDIFRQEIGVVRMLLLGGPAACLVNASVGVGTLWLAGLIPTPNLPFSWWTWWVGDSIGVIVFTPLAMIWNPAARTPRLRQQLVVTAPLVVLFAVVVGLFFFVSKREEERIRIRMDSDAAAYAQKLDAALNNYVSALYSLQSLFDSSQEVERAEFSSFTRRLLQQLPGVQGLSWNRELRDTQRDAYEAAMRGQGFAGFELREIDAQGRLQTAARRPRYVVVDYVEPMEQNRKALGLDVLTESSRADAIQRALASGAPALTRPLRLAQANGVRVGFLVLLPFQRQQGKPPLAPDTVEGYVTAVFRLDAAVEHVFAEMGASGIEYALYDVTEAGHEEPLIHSRNYEPRSVEQGGLRQTALLDWGGRRWQLDCVVPGAYLVANRSWAAWSLLAGGLVLVGLLGMMLLVLIGRQAKVEEMVEQQTAELRLSEQRFRELLDHAPDAMIIVDQTGAIRLVNGAAEQVFGYARDELIGHPVEMLLPEQFRAAHPAHRQAFVTGPVARRMMASDRELHALRKDGSELPVEVSLGMMQFRREHYVLATVRDISERRALEAQVAQASERLRHSNEELEQFAYVVSHDLKAPVRGIVGLTGVLADKLSASADADTLDLLKLVIDSGRHMQRLIADLLALAKVGRDSAGTQATDCAQVVKAVLAQMQGHIAERGAEVQVEEPLPRVMATPIELHQLFQNLIDNGLKFHKEGHPRVRITAQRDGSYWRLAVSDNGIGIPPDKLQKIFGVFERLHSRQEFEGTGIGLAICQKIVERHGGRIWVESQPGQGASFHFTLKAAD
ncbi:MAG TPA: CHASE domain-containing protein [Solimonas sp.]|nr:CHASE domain-containing protein [Solimonas sp.]